VRVLPGANFRLSLGTGAAHNFTQYIDVYCLYMFHPVLSVKHLHAFASNLKPCQEKLETLTGQLWYATRVYFMWQHPPSATRHTRIRKSHKITISPGPMAVAQLCCIHHNSHLSGLDWRADVARNAQNALEKPDVYGTYMAPSSFRCMFRFIHKFHPQN
jgi:hypothetical protein